MMAVWQHLTWIWFSSNLVMSLCWQLLCCKKNLRLVCDQSSLDQLYKGSKDHMDPETSGALQSSLHTGQQAGATVKVFMGPWDRWLSALLHKWVWWPCLLLQAQGPGVLLLDVPQAFPSDSPREKNADLHCPQPAPSVPFPVLQKLLAFTVPTSVSSNHSALSSPPLGPQPWSPLRLCLEASTKDEERRCSQATWTSPSGKRTSVWASTLGVGRRKTLREYTYNTKRIKFSWHTGKLLTQR